MKEPTSKFLLALALACAVHLTASAKEAISPFDDVQYWFRGGVDLDGNGVYDSGSREFRDVTRMAETNGAAHACSLVVGSYGKMRAKTGRVIMPYANRALADAPYLHLEQKVVTNNWVTHTDGKQYPNVTLSGDYFKFPKDGLFANVPDNVDITNYTIFVRFRQHAKACDLQNEENFIQAGFSWVSGAGSGISLALYPQMDGNNKPIANEKYLHLYYGGCHLDFSRTATKFWRYHWTDLALIVNGRTITAAICCNKIDTGTTSTNALFTTETVTASNANATPAILSGKHWLALGGESTSSVTFTDGVNKSGDNVVKNFRGDIQSFAFWTRALTVDEVRHVFSERRPALVKMGLANGSTDEFQKLDDTVDAVGHHPETWNPVLNAAHPTASVTFEVISGEHATSQYLRVRPVGTAPATLSAAIDGQAISSLSFANGDDAFAYVQSKFLTIGKHTLTLTRTDANGGDFAIDAFSLAGSWRIGTDHEHGGMAQEDGTEGPLYNPCVFPVTDGNLKHFTRGFVSASFNDEHKIAFELPADLLTLTRDPTFTISHTSSQSGQSISFDLYVNDTKLTSYTSKIWTSNSFTIPLSLLKAGSNTIQIKLTGGASWSNCSYYRFELGRLISGMLVIVK